MQSLRYEDYYKTLLYHIKTIINAKSYRILLESKSHTKISKNKYMKYLKYIPNFIFYYLPLYKIYFPTQ